MGVYVDLDLVGDALIKLPFVRALRHAYPAAELIWIAGRGRCAYAGALAPLMPGLLDRVIEQCGVGAGLRKALGPPRLDVLIDTQSHVGTTLALRALWPRRFVSAAANYWLSGVAPPRGYRKPRRLIRRLLDLAEFASGRKAATEGALALPAEARARAAALLPPGPCYVAQVVGAGGRHKAWPVERHAELAEALMAVGRAPVLILGPAEQDLAAPLAARLPGARFPLQEAGAAADVALTVALGASCAAAVAADCGGGHMLAASGVPAGVVVRADRPGEIRALGATRDGAAGAGFRVGRYGGDSAGAGAGQSRCGDRIIRRRLRGPTMNRTLPAIPRRAVLGRRHRPLARPGAPAPPSRSASACWPTCPAPMPMSAAPARWRRRDWRWRISAVPCWGGRSRSCRPITRTRATWAWRSRASGSGRRTSG